MSGPVCFGTPRLGLSPKSTPLQAESASRTARNAELRTSAVESGRITLPASTAGPCYPILVDEDAAGHVERLADRGEGARRKLLATLQLGMVVGHT